jgi:hypothetical protein
MRLMDEAHVKEKNDEKKLASKTNVLPSIRANNAFRGPKKVITTRLQQVSGPFHSKSHFDQALAQSFHAVRTTARVRMLKVRVSCELSRIWNGRLGLFLQRGVFFLGKLHEEANNLGQSGGRKLPRSFNASSVMIW